MTVTLYHNPRCSKSRAALALLQERGVDLDVVEYIKTPLSATAIKELLALLGVTARDLIRPKDARDAGVNLDGSDAALVKAMADEPRLIERPIAVNGDRAAIGRPPENVLDIL